MREKQKASKECYTRIIKSYESSSKSRNAKKINLIATLNLALLHRDEQPPERVYQQLLDMIKQEVLQAKIDCQDEWIHVHTIHALNAYEQQYSFNDVPV